MSLKLPNEIEQYVASLQQLYNQKNQDLLQRLLVNAEIVIEENSYDNWDGGQYGFIVRLLIPDVIFAEIIDRKEEYEKEIVQNLNKLINVSNEFIECISIEMQLSEENNWREKSGLVVLPQKHITNNILQRIWKPGYVRAFLSHKAKYKANASKLKDKLEMYGISCFVAHKDIQPTKEWLQEIENALFSMDILVALMSEDFHESDWTDQEVGVAVGCNIPIIPIKISRDPYGFIGKYQAISGNWNDINKMAREIFNVTIKHSVTKEKIKHAVIYAFKDSECFENSKQFIKEVFPIFEKFNDAQIEKIISAFNENCQIYDCYAAKNNLPSLLYNWTGNRYYIIDNKIVKDSPKTRQSEAPDDIPF